MDKSSVVNEPSQGKESAFSFSFQTLSSRGVIFGLCVVLFAVCTLFAFSQPPQSDPLQPAGLNTWNGWKHPIEKNGFRRLHLTGADLESIYTTPDGVHIWVIGYGDMILHSSDKGVSWEKQALPDAVVEKLQPPSTPSSISLSKASFTSVFSTRKAHAADKIEKKYQAPEQTKKEVKVRKVPETQPAPIFYPENTLSGICFVSPVKGWVTGSRGRIYHTIDGGRNWKLQQSGTDAYISSVFFLADGIRGWAVGEGGTTLFTENSGDTWEKPVIPAAFFKEFRLFGLQQPPLLNTVFFTLDGKRGWAAGRFGVILMTEDGGREWVETDSKTDKPLNAIWFHENSRNGWAAGDNGTLLKTSDGGRSWEPVDSKTGSNLNRLWFSPDGQNGWIAGNGGVVLYTETAGRKWERLETGAGKADLHGIGFSSSGRSGWIIGSNGFFKTTRDGGRTWLNDGLRRFDLASVVFPHGAKKGWAAGTDGVILLTEDRGRTWQSVTTFTGRDITDLAFSFDGKKGLVAGHGNTLFYTENGGLSWQAPPPAADSDKFIDFTSVFLSPEGERAWAAGTNGVIVHTPDAGRTWQEQPVQPGVQINDIVFARDGQRGWAAGEKGILFKTDNGGENWTSSSATRGETLRALCLSEDGVKGWAVGDKGRIFKTVNNGARWERVEPVTNAALHAVWFTPDGKRGWAAGERGTLLYSDNGGVMWRTLQKPTDAVLHDIWFSEDGSTGWVAGEGGTLLTSSDRGMTWEDGAAPYACYPAPWYFFSLVLIAVFLIPAFRKPSARIADDPSVADTLASDRPLEAGDPDPLHFGAIARALSMFLRNEKTQPPLTIAVTGDWGAGKSSLMNLLRSDLRQYGFKPVWFNAWHHQREDNMLAALIENIISQAPPKWWTPGGWFFRCRLAIIRGWKYWAPLLIMVFLSSFLASYFYKNRPETIEEIPTRLHEVFTGKSYYKVDEEAIRNLLSDPDLKEGKQGIADLLEIEFQSREQFERHVQTAFEGPEDKAPFTGIRLHRIVKKGGLQKIAIFGGVVLSILAGLRKFLSAFGLNPADLMASVSGKFSAKNARAQLGFREKYAKEFKAVTQAFDKHTLVIFIDDLDRCLPDNTLAVLEAINYLVSSGTCFIVIGMDMKRVERCVGLGFRDIAAEMTEEAMSHEEKNPGHENNNDDMEKIQRWKFAHQYLEKLINIEVPVPVPDQAQAGELMLSSSRRAQKKTDVLKPVTHFIRSIIPIVFLIGVLSAGLYLGLRNPSEVKMPGEAEYTAAVNEEAAGFEEGEERAAGTAGSSDPGGKIDEVKDRTTFFRQGQSDQPGAGLFLWPLGILAVVGIFVFLRRPDVVVRDSARFKSAINVWLPVIASVHNTPRSIKRLKNRLRYFAMRLRSSSSTPPDKGIWKRFSGSWADQGKGGQDLDLTESTIVALGTLHHCDPALLALHTLDPSQLDPSMLGHLEADLAKDIIQALAHHVRGFENWPPSENQLKLFTFISSNIHVN